MGAMGEMARRVRTGALPWGVVALLAAVLVLFTAWLAYRDATKPRPWNTEALREPWKPGSSGQGANEADDRAVNPSDRDGLPANADPSATRRPPGPADEAGDASSAEGAGQQQSPGEGAAADEDAAAGNPGEASGAPTPTPSANPTPRPPSGAASADTGARERAIEEGRKADVEAWDRAVECARARLRVPESAVFVEFGAPETSVRWTGETVTVQGYVEARTGTGRTSRSRFRTVLEQKEGFLWERETAFDETR